MEKCMKMYQNKFSKKTDKDLLILYRDATENQRRLENEAHFTKQQSHRIKILKRSDTQASRRFKFHYYGLKEIIIIKI